MFLLYEKPPAAVEVGGKMYRLNLAFDRVLIAYSALEDTEMTFEDQLEVFLSMLVVGKLPAKEMWQSLFLSLQDILGGASPTVPKYDLDGNQIMTKPSKTKLDFSFDFDAGYIYAAFMQTYGIDLINQCGKLHWYKFISLFNGLPSETQLSRIREIRSTDLNKVKDKNAKRELRIQKREFALPDADEEGGDDYG
jgi:hypothetical protein